MHRFFAPEAGRTERVTLPESESQHATRVLRLPAGSEVTLLDGQGGEFGGILELTGRHHASVRIISRHQHPAPSGNLTLIQAVAKGPAMDGLVHRAVELGCRRLIPLVTDRSVSRPDHSGDKQARWQTIAIEAAKQSGNPWKMQVDSPLTPQAWLARKDPFDLLWIASLQDTPCAPQTRWNSFRSQHGSRPRSVGILIGPEGDFSPAEYEAFRQHGAQSISLGPWVLRVETAATTAMALIQNLLQASDDFLGT